MSDLSRLLDDVYNSGAAPAEPSWPSDAALDDVFADWVPGTLVEASAAERAFLDEAVEDTGESEYLLDTEDDGEDQLRALLDEAVSFAPVEVDEEPETFASYAASIEVDDTLETLTADATYFDVEDDDLETLTADATVFPVVDEADEVDEPLHAVLELVRDEVDVDVAEPEPEAVADHSLWDSFDLPAPVADEVEIPELEVPLAPEAIEAEDVAPAPVATWRRQDDDILPRGRRRRLSLSRR